MKLLIVVASNPYSHDFNTSVKLAKASLDRNHSVSMFFMANGVSWAESSSMYGLSKLVTESDRVLMFD